MELNLNVHAVILFSCAAFYKWAVALFPYSGKGKLPLFGDYEAQRHWQEITVNLPTNEWYVNSLRNDLLYWGLDYPPLTAYHSWVVGKVAGHINASWVQLNSSRGIESDSHKLYMRYSVLISDMVIFWPAVFLYATSHPKLKQWLPAIGLLFYPGLALIDYGHFQYNCVSLGLFILAVYFLETKHLLFAGVAFSLALNYKQMELYHAIPFFVYMLSNCLKSNGEYRLWRLVKLTMFVLATFALCWMPFLGSQEEALAVVRRLFPFSRGLFEDKVSNVWCSLNVIVKIKQLLSQEQLVKLCACSTMLSVLPSSVKLFVEPSLRNFKLCLTISSLAFFLLSYQVHEKSILIAAVSAQLLASEEPVAVTWFSLVTTFSMLPLLIKDGLLPAYIATSLIYAVIMIAVSVDFYRTFHALMMSATIVIMSLLMIGSVAIAPPARYPDLWPVLISSFSCLLFVVFYCYLHYRLIARNEKKRS